MGGYSDSKNYGESHDYDNYKSPFSYGDSYQDYGGGYKSKHESQNYDNGSPKSEGKQSQRYSYDMDTYGGSHSKRSKKYETQDQGYFDNINKYDKYYDDYTRKYKKELSKFDYNEGYSNNEVSPNKEYSRSSYDPPNSYGASAKFKPKLDYGNYDDAGYYPSYDPPSSRRKRGGRRSQYGSYSSVEPSYNPGKGESTLYNPGKGEPRQAYDPTSWARWMTGDDGGGHTSLPARRSRRKVGYKRPSSGQEFDSSGWKGSTGPRGRGGSPPPPR